MFILVEILHLCCEQACIEHSFNKSHNLYNFLLINFDGQMSTSA